MKTNNLLLKYVNWESKREVGRYWASDIYSIIKKQLTPENYFEKKSIDLTGARNIISGMAFEAQLKHIFEKNNVKFQQGNDIKRELKIEKDIILVVKPDFEFKNWVLETKYPTKKREKVPEWYLYQLEAEYRATKKEVVLGLFSYPFNVTYINYEPNQKRWDKICETLVKFHNQLKNK